RNTGAALTRNLFSSRNIDHIDRQIRQLGAESRRQVITARLDKAQFRVGELSLHIIDGGEVHRGVLANSGVRAATRLDPHDALGGQCLRAHENELILLGVNIVRDHVDVVVGAQSLAEAFDECGLAGADRTPNPDTQGPVLPPCRCVPEIAGIHERNSLVYWVSCSIETRSTTNAADPRSSMVSF